MILNGDCIKEMQKLIDDGVQVDSVVTDPPYELGFMGRSWDSTGIAFQKETWELALKLLKPGGHLLAFSASRNYHRMAVAIEDVGFEIRDQMMWLYGSGFPKSMNVGKAFDKKLGNSEWEGWGTALKPAHEPIVMARKPLSEKSIVDNVLKHGTGAINIDECRVEGEVKRPDTNPDFRDVAKKAMAEGGQDKLNFNQITGAKRKKVVRKSRNESGVWTDGNSGMKAEGTEYADADPRGRFPANVMHDGSDVIVNQFPEGAKGSTAPRNRDTVGMFGMPNDATSEYADEGSAARFFYCPKTSKSERHSNLDDHETKNMGMSGGAQSKGESYDKGQGIGLNRVIEKKNTHPTVKPVELMRYLCRLVTPKGGTVLDPFMGSGSTGMAAKDEGFDFIGIEKEKEYFDISESRIKRFAPLMDFM